MTTQMTVQMTRQITGYMRVITPSVQVDFIGYQVAKTRSTFTRYQVLQRDRSLANGCSRVIQESPLNSYRPSTGAECRI